MATIAGSGGRYYQGQWYSWSFHRTGGNGFRKLFEIDVSPFNPPELFILRLVFVSGTLPDMTWLEWEARANGTRVSVEWLDSWDYMASRVNYPFNWFLFGPDKYAEGWEQRALYAWWTTPLRELGWYTPLELVRMGNGPYEIAGVGFAWVGREFRWYPLSTMEEFNDTIRWFLRHGTSLGDALAYNSAQQRNLNMEGAACGVIALAPFAKTGGMPERTIQEIAKRPTIPIARLQPRAKPASVRWFSPSVRRPSASRGR